MASKKTCAICMADGFETIEGLAPLDVMTRAGVEVDTIACTGDTGQVATSNGVLVSCTAQLGARDLSAYDLVVIPGGVGGVDNLRQCPLVTDEIARRMNAGELLGAICAGPMLLAEQHLLDGRTATCYPGCDVDFPAGVRPEKNGVYTDKNLITGSGPAFAVPFGLALTTALLGPEAAQSVASAMLVD